MNQVFLFLIVGLAAGILSGLLGIGGGAIVIPVLVFFFGYTQHQAQGTTLAMLVPPIGLLAALMYYKLGYVNLKVAGLLCLGFFFGGLLGARLASVVPDAMLRRVFGVFFILIALRLIFQK
jgi:uncharacterized protein